MKLQNTVEDQMASLLSCFWKKSLVLMAVLTPLLITLALSLSFGLFSLLFTSTALIFSALLVTSSKQNIKQPIENPPTEEILSSFDEQISPEVEEVLSKPQPENEPTRQEEPKQEMGLHQINEKLVRSPDLLSESEGLDQLSTSEDSEVDWLFQGHVDRSPDCSDGSISDEESLIEIALPGGYYVGQNYKDQEEPKFNLQQKVTDFMPQSIFKEHSIMELLAEINEMNEEDNLIEIDISMGSIKYSRFEIEA